MMNQMQYELRAINENSQLSLGERFSRQRNAVTRHYRRGFELVPFGDFSRAYKNSLIRGVLDLIVDNGIFQLTPAETKAWTSNDNFADGSLDNTLSGWKLTTLQEVVKLVA